MTRKQLKKHLSGLKAAKESYPFGPDTIVFKVMGKMFALISEKAGVPIVTLKCIPFDGEILVGQFESIVPGYYMNKKHWITISLTDEISKDMLFDLTDKSYSLVVSKLTKADRLKIEQQTASE